MQLTPNALKYLHRSSATVVHLPSGTVEPLAEADETAEVMLLTGATTSALETPRGSDTNSDDVVELAAAHGDDGGQFSVSTVGEMKAIICKGGEVLTHDGELV